MPTDLTSKRAVVMGLGRFGGGVGVSRFLLSRGADVLVTDLEPPDKLTTSLKQLQDLPIRFRLGEHNVSDFTTADLIVVNPAVDKRNNRFLRAASAANVPLTTEIRLLINHLPTRSRTIAVTGSAGKSTTTAMIGHVLAKLLGPSRVHVGGNIGGSLLQNVDHIRPADWVVLELSSFMLEDIAHDRWSPHVAVVTNLTPNHLDRHETFQAYALAKQTILEFQHPDDYAILGPVPHHLIKPRTTRVLFSDGWDTFHHLPEPRLLIPGIHNLLNARFAIEAAACTGLSRLDAAKALEDFPGLPHRLQLVCEHVGVRYFNDSKATTPEATTLALQSFLPNTVHLIAGGYDKKSDLTPLAHLAARHCRNLYTIGATGNPLADTFDSAPVKLSAASAIRAQTLDIAVLQTASRVRQGDVVLLSPACASWDQFENYEQRGAAFAAAVLKYTSEGAPSPLPSQSPQ